MIYVKKHKKLPLTKRCYADLVISSNAVKKLATSAREL